MNLQLTLVIFLFIPKLLHSIDLKIILWSNEIQKDVDEDVVFVLKEFEKSFPDKKIQIINLVISEENEDVLQKFCYILTCDGGSVIIDLQYDLWQDGMTLVKKYSIAYLKVDRMIKPFLNMFADFLQEKGGNDVVLILQNYQDVFESLEQMIQGFPFRTMLLNGLSEDIEQLNALRPNPSYYAVFAKGSNMNAIFEKIKNASIFLRPTEWHFVFLDTRDKVFKYKKLVEHATKFTLNAKSICKSLEMKESFCYSGFTIQRAMLLQILISLINLYNFNQEIMNVKNFECNIKSSFENATVESNIIANLNYPDFLYFSDSSENYKGFENLESISFSVNVTISFYSNEHEAATDLAVWSEGNLLKINSTISGSKRFFRIGVTEAIPWSYLKRDSSSGEIIFSGEGNPQWEGFCIDYIKTLSEKLYFDYELVPPAKGTFGKRNADGTWDGIIGDLVHGQTDFAVTALKMYSEREEVVDFIAPYFEQTGISIVIRKAVRQTSLFKFMTVLRLEVWLSIIGALVATAFMLWIMDKYSPYSSRNNKESFPYPCREFTLRESFWFALTSFTPQGGGEAPKAISGRILVAAYWLFVVLMLATFTANLAAFLTVERMQTPVQSLDQLARQSRINYTVVLNSDTHQYFINMKFAEDTLYRMWKELSLNASADYQKYRIWDYPIREQYGHILLAINASNPVKDAKEGFRLVNEHENADFAFIHDSSEIKYEITQNCNLTEVGEVFGEQPYSIAVQQGSHLADELSYATLELQKDRYFEELKTKYWNQSKLKMCPVSENQEGISLESLGGVFLATLFGLGLAMVTLAFEVFFYKKKLFSKEQQTSIVQVKPVHDEKDVNYTQENETREQKMRRIQSKILIGDGIFRPGQAGLKSRRAMPLDSNEKHQMISAGYLE